MERRHRSKGTPQGIETSTIGKFSSSRCFSPASATLDESCLFALGFGLHHGWARLKPRSSHELLFKLEPHPQQPTETGEGCHVLRTIWSSTGSTYLVCLGERTGIVPGLPFPASDDAEAFSIYLIMGQEGCLFDIGAAPPLEPCFQA